jgi:glycosyltransferase involved in cell wall biosynthesis
MNKIIYVPLEHIDGRYTTHMDRDIQNYLKQHKIPFVLVYPEQAGESGKLPEGCFLNAAYTSKFKSMQMAQIAGMYERGMIQDGDKFFFSDLWFPGIESIAYMNYFHKVDAKITGVIHAGSFTDTDFVRDMERWAKNFEDIIFDIADTVYCASEFIRADILKKRFVHPEKLVVSGLPLDINHLKDIDQSNKINRVVFNGRLCDEKQPWLFDKLAERFPDASFEKTQELGLSKQDYYKLLAESKVVVSFALQENFGFGIAEAAYLGCVPVLPDRLVYPELYADHYLYDNFEKCCELVGQALDNKLPSVLQCNVPGVNHNCMDIWFKEITK